MMILQMIVVVLYVVTVLFCIGSCLFVYCNRKKVIVSLGQPVYLYQLCIAGILLLSPLVLNEIVTDDTKFYFATTHMFINTNRTLYSLNRDAFLYTEEGKVEFNYNDKTLTITSAFAGMISSRQQIAYDMGCNLAVALAWIGIVLTNTVLFAKTYRVYKVTLFRRNQTIKPRNVLGPYIISVVFSATVLIALTATSPIHYSTMIKYIPTNGSSQYYNQCYDVNKINGAMFAFNIIIELGILVLAWKVRNTNEELGESRKIFILIILLIALDIAMVVVCSLILWKFFRIISIVLVLKSLLPIWFLICPRMYYVWYEYKHGHLPQSVIVPGMGHVTVAGTDNITNPPGTNNYNQK